VVALLLKQPGLKLQSDSPLHHSSIFKSKMETSMFQTVRWKKDGEKLFLRIPDASVCILDLEAQLIKG
jgi:hypothetical protein